LEADVAERLGNVAFWLNCIVAGGFVAAALWHLYLMLTAPPWHSYQHYPADIATFLGLAVAVMLLGWAIRYVIENGKEQPPAG
jgi:hypothetical protein